MKYKHLILKMVLAMSDDDYLFKIYHYILAKYRKEEHKAEHEEVEERKAEVIRIVSEMDNAAIIASIYSFIMGILSVKKDGAE